MVIYLFIGRILLEGYVILRMIVFFKDLKILEGDNDKNVIYLCGITGCKNLFIFVYLFLFYLF